MPRVYSDEKKTDRLYIRTTNSMKTNLQYLANKNFGGNLNLLIDTVLKNYIEDNKEG